MIPFLLTLNWASFSVVLECTKILFCVSTAVPAAEFLLIRQAFKPQGVFAGPMMALNDTRSSMLPPRWEAVLFSYPTFVVIHLARLVLCIALLFIPVGASFYVLSTIALLTIIFLYRNPLGSDGSDQMNLIICIALAILYVLPNNLAVAKISLYFIAVQSLLAYFVAGVAKLSSIEWRSGLAVKAIMNTRSYGNFGVSKYLNQDRPVLNVVLCWSIIVMEMTFPLVLLLPAPYFWLIICWGVCFHLYNAVVMGLNVFFWAFIATYPSIFFLRISLGVN